MSVQLECEGPSTLAATASASVVGMAIIIVVLPILLLLLLLLLLVLRFVFRFCCCCWQPLRLPPRGVVRCDYFCWHVLKLEFWHFVHPQLNSAFAFASVLCFIQQKSAPAAGLHGAKTC